MPSTNNCTIYVREDIWKNLIETAREQAARSRGQYSLRAFFAFSSRGEGWPIRVIEHKEVPVRILKPDSPSGPIFRWDYPRDKKEEYYPRTTSNRKYFGTVLIHPILEMTLHYAYYMRVDFKGSGGFNINLWIRNQNPVYKAYFVGDRTNGEFLECRVEPYQLRQSPT